jgi:uncharacterized membrane protein
MFSGIRTDATVAGLELNTLGDGLFHLLDWLLTIAGIFFLWRSAQEKVVLATQTFLGALLLGMGLFNLVEGIIDHHLLEIHHVKAGPHQLAYDIGYLVISALLAAIGWFLLRSSLVAPVRTKQE